MAKRQSGRITGKGLLGGLLAIPVVVGLIAIAPDAPEQPRDRDWNPQPHPSNVHTTTPTHEPTYVPPPPGFPQDSDPGNPPNLDGGGDKDRINCRWISGRCNINWF